MRELVEQIARALVDYPEDVQGRAVEGSEVTVLELRTAAQDLGKVIGRDGRTAKAIRTLLGAGGMKLRRRFTLEILEDAASSSDEWKAGFRPNNEGRTSAKCAGNSGE